MKNAIEIYREKFLDEYDLKLQKEYFSDKENKDLNEIIKIGDQTALYSTLIPLHKRMF